MSIARVPPPHIRRAVATHDIMGDVCIALIPCMVAAVWFFKTAALIRLVTAAAASLLAGRLTGKRNGADMTALVTGLILCLSCPAGIPLWLLLGGCFFAVCVVRDGFGGVGKNIFNPAMAARAVLLTVFPAQLVGYALPDASSSATPLAEGRDLLSLTVGRINGSMGETSALMIALGLIWLCMRRVVRLRVPLFFLLGFGIAAALSGQSLLRGYLSGGLLFGAVFVVTDFTGKPVTTVGELLFAAGVGALTAVLRAFGVYPEGVCFAVLVGNVCTPFIEYFTIPRRLAL